MNPVGLIEPYLAPLGSATLAFPAAAAALTLPLAAYHYRRYGRLHPWRALLGYSFVFYLVVAASLVLLPLPPIPRGEAEIAAWKLARAKYARPELDPLRFIRMILHARSDRGRALALSQALFNVALLLPFGAYLVYLFKRPVLVAALLGLGLSLLFETAQFTGLFGLFPGPYRWFDAGDLLANSAGALLGALLALLLARLRVLPPLDSLQGPEGAGVGPFRRALALVVDLLALGLSLLGGALVLDLAGDPPEIAYRVAMAALAAAWLLLLPALDRGRGPGARILLFSFVGPRNAPAGFLRLLLRQGLLWGPPLAVLGLPPLAPGSELESTIRAGAAFAWAVLALANAAMTALSKEGRGPLDRLSGTRARSAWRGAAAGGARPAAPLRATVRGGRGSGRG